MQKQSLLMIVLLIWATTKMLASAPLHDYVENSCNGVILKAPGGSCYMIVVEDGGQLITKTVPCP